MKYICDKCGTEMIDKSKGAYIHYVCPKCGEAIATYDYTKDDPIKIDDKIYTVKSTNNISNSKTLKVLSKITGLNYINCKKIIDENNVICTGTAKDIIEPLRLLKCNGVLFEISPQFNYKI